MEKFSEILKDLIDDTGLSLRELEKESGVSNVSYGKYLKGVYPKLDTLMLICNYFDCSIDYLCGFTDVKTNYGNSYHLNKFIQRYSEILDANNTTHWKFSKKYNLSESNLRHWKSGDIPKLENLIVIAEHLGCSIDYLIGKSDIK